MKKIIILTIILFAFGANLFAQDTGNDSYTIKRLIIFNDKGEILLEKNNSGWMTPALRHNRQVTINDSLYELANDFGLKISAPRLAGIFTFISTYKKNASLRFHYTSKHIEGELKTPKGKSDAKWFQTSKAIDMMSLPETKVVFAVRDMTKQVLNYPEIVWGGSFILSRDNGKILYKIGENFYPLSK